MKFLTYFKSIDKYTLFSPIGDNFLLKDDKNLYLLNDSLKTILFQTSFPYFSDVIKKDEKDHLFLLLLPFNQKKETIFQSDNLSPVFSIANLTILKDTIIKDVILHNGNIIILYDFNKKTQLLVYELNSGKQEVYFLEDEFHFDHLSYSSFLNCLLLYSSNEVAIFSEKKIISSIKLPPFKKIFLTRKNPVYISLEEKRIAVYSKNGKLIASVDNYIGKDDCDVDFLVDEKRELIFVISYNDNLKISRLSILSYVNFTLLESIVIKKRVVSLSEDKNYLILNYIGGVKVYRFKEKKN